jgi:hypothetical protein
MKRLFLVAAGLLLVSGQLAAAVGDTISLDEKWLFKLSRNVASVPKNVESTRFDDSQWRFMTIPGLWRVPTAWQSVDYVGVYRGWIKMLPDMKGKRVFLHMGFTTAATDVFVNGERIGQTERDRAQTEFEITDKIVIGQRNLFVFRMNHYDQGEDATNTRGNSGITSQCYIYTLPQGSNPAPLPVIGKAGNKVRVGDRFSFEPEEGFIDSEKRIDEDMALMRRMGFGAFTYNKLSSDPAFIAYVRQHGMDVVTDVPITSVPLVDANRKLTDAVYAYLPAYDFNFKQVIKEGVSRADVGVVKPKAKKKETDDVLTISDALYTLAFNKYTGLIASYAQNGVSVFSGGATIRPASKSKLVSLTSTKPDKSGNTRVTAVYDIDGEGRSTWVYDIGNNGVLKISADVAKDIEVSFGGRLTRGECYALGLDGPEQLPQPTYERPQVFWWRQSADDGKGVQLVPNKAFTALKPVYKSQLLMRNAEKGIELTFVPAPQ